jgi:hypothetical protein
MSSEREGARTPMPTRMQNFAARIRMRIFAQQRARWPSRLRRRCEGSGVPPVETALGLGGTELSAGERHGFENFFVLEGGFDVRALGLGDRVIVRIRRRSIFVFVFHSRFA